jgi:predicted ATPase/DNA-binding SARP family transcriptional activator/Tfp pilus assembly protein PilF
MNIDETNELENFQDAQYSARLVLSLLGPPQVSVNGKVVLQEKQQKILALLAYLAVEAHRPHQRSALAALFWPDQPERQAVQNLRKTLSRLRRTIGDHAADPPHLIIKKQTIRFNSDSDAWLDVTAFTKQVSGVQEHHHRRLDACPICLLKLAQGVEYYRGSFLAGVHSVGSIFFDEWLTVRREQLEQQACSALYTLAKSHLAQGKAELVCRYTRRLLRLDPWNEAGHRLQLQALALSEGRNVALLHYEQFQQELDLELGVALEDETIALVDQIQKGAFASGQRGAPAAQLPTPATLFVGREAERRQINEYLTGYEQRLLTIIGPGGSGKSRLALEIANEQNPFWRDGVWFVSLADVPDPEGLAGVLASTLGYEPKGGLETGGLIDFLKRKETLLILDSYEHLAADSSLIQEILRSARQVSILVTSRIRLGIHREWVIPLDGLDIPPDLPESLDGAEMYSAVALFVQNAGRAAPEFQLSAENLADVLRICRQVDGLPLGIELASAWVRMFPPRKIADEIERSQDFLHSQKKNLGRLHSLRASFNYSYNLLSESERTLFRQLSIFRGGFTVVACRAICGRGPDHLVSLLDKSLLEASTYGRLRLHLTLREYAAERLAEYPLEQTAARMRHGEFYLAFLREREEALAGERAKEALDQIQVEIANVRTAWEWSIAQNEIDSLCQFAPTLAVFYNRRGLFQEGETVFRHATEHLFGASPVPDTQVSMCLLARLRLEQARFLFGMGEYAGIAEHTQAAITLAAACGDGTLEAQAELIRGYVHHIQGEMLPACKCFERALSLSRSGSPAAGAPELKMRREAEANSLNCLALVSKRQGKYDEAERYLEQSLQAAREAKDLAGQCRALNGLGSLVSRRGDFSRALAYYQEALHDARASGDRRLEGALLNNLGNIHLRLGLYDEAGAHYEQALEIQRGIGARQKEISPRFNLGLIHHYLGEQEMAMSCFQEALQIAQAMGDLRAQGFVWMGMGHALLDLHALVDAYASYQKAISLRRELDQEHLIAEPLAGLAQVALNQEDLTQAMEISEDILKQLENGSLEGTTDPFQVYLTCYNVLKANHDARAGQFLTSAHQELQRRAVNIGDEGLRRSYLENVPSQRKLERLVQESED